MHPLKCDQVLLRERMFATSTSKWHTLTEIIQVMFPAKPRGGRSLPRVAPQERTKYEAHGNPHGEENPS